MVEKRKVRCTHGKTWGQIKRQYLPRPTCFPWKRYFGGKKADDRRNQRRSLNQLPTTVSSPLSNSISFQKTSQQLIDALSDDKLTHFPETFRTLSSITTGDHRVLLNKHETRTREESHDPTELERDDRRERERRTGSCKDDNGNSDKIKQHGYKEPWRTEIVSTKKRFSLHLQRRHRIVSTEVTEPSSPSRVRGTGRGYIKISSLYTCA